MSKNSRDSHKNYTFKLEKDSRVFKLRESVIERFGLDGIAKMLGFSNCENPKVADSMIYLAGLCKIIETSENKKDEDMSNIIQNLGNDGFDGLARLMKGKQPTVPEQVNEPEYEELSSVDSRLVDPSGQPFNKQQSSDKPRDQGGTKSETVVDGEKIPQGVGADVYDSGKPWGDPKQNISKRALDNEADRLFQLNENLANTGIHHERTYLRAGGY